MSPTQRSLKLLRQEGFTCAVVERWNNHAKIRQDLWGCDVLAINRRDKIFLLVQTTTDSHLANRRAKLLQRVEARDWVEAGGVVEVHGWRDDGSVRRESLALADFAGVVQWPKFRGRKRRQPGLFSVKGGQ